MAAALPFSTIETKLFSLEQDDSRSLFSAHKSKEVLEIKGPHEIAGVFRGRELTRKERRLTCGITPIDNLIGGGIVRGRLSEIVGGASAGKTSLAAAFAAKATAHGEVAAWIDASGGFDPASTAAAGVDLARMLWVAMPSANHRRDYRTMDEIDPRESQCPLPIETEFSSALSNLSLDKDRYAGGRLRDSDDRRGKRSASVIVLKAAEWILTAGGFGLVVIDCGGAFCGHSTFTQSAALRLARGAERSGAAVLVIGSQRMCGTFAALSLMLSRSRACFSRTAHRAPMLFDGLAVEARVMRNKLGGAGGVASWRALIDTSCTSIPAMPASEPMHKSATAARSTDSFRSLNSAVLEHNTCQRAVAR